MAVEHLLSVEQLSVVLHKSPSSIRSDASRKPTSLPPICRLPGTKRLLWRQEDVDAWLAQFIAYSNRQTEDVSLKQIDNAPETKRRGRPSKAVQVARVRQRASGAMQPPEVHH